MAPNGYYVNSLPIKFGSHNNFLLRFGTVPHPSPKKKEVRGMRRIVIIVFLFFMVFVFVCCESKKEAMARREAEEQKRYERYEKRDKESRQWNFTRMRKSQPGRYEIFQHRQFVKNTFLLDTIDGRVWIIIEDKETKGLLWQEINVENREILSIEEFFKDDK